MAIKRSADVRASPPRPRTAKRILTTESPPPPPPYLPSEVIFGILSWLPSRSVLRFRCVCKAWQAMLSDPVFITAHHECSKKIRPSLLMVPRRRRGGAGAPGGAARRDLPVEQPAALRRPDPHLHHAAAAGGLQPGDEGH
uniref:Uncharacterized protein n=1 Tax=Aegilops tauschii TaxID=37682 RepID=N1R0Q5_AEGTA